MILAPAMGKQSKILFQITSDKMKKIYWIPNCKGTLDGWSDNLTLCLQAGLQQDLNDVKLFREILKI